MEELIKKWRTKYEALGNAIEYHIIQNKTYSHGFRDYTEDMYYALIHFKDFDLDVTEIEEKVGHKLPEDFKNMLQQFGFFKIEDEHGNLYVGFKAIGFLNNRIEIDKTNEPGHFYSKDEMYLIQHGFSVAKSCNYDDSDIFIAFDEKGNAMLGQHNHDDAIFNVQPYSLDALLELIDEDLEDFYEAIVETIEEDKEELNDK